MQHPPPIKNISQKGLTPIREFFILSPMRKVKAFCAKTLISGLLALLFTPSPALAELSPATPQCVVAAGRKYLVPVDIILAVLATEKGMVGQTCHNKNGTVDIGPMQINTVHFDKARKYDIDIDELRDNGCLNIFFGTWLLANLLEKYEPWEAIGIYHSRTPHIKQRYQNRVWERKTSLDTEKLFKYINKPIETYQQPE